MIHGIMYHSSTKKRKKRGEKQQTNKNMDTIQHETQEVQQRQNKIETQAVRKTTKLLHIKL